MEKLIKLVCEYDRFKEGKHMDRCITNGDFDNKFYRLYIISKEYGFIKRLFEKKKIDLDEMLIENGLFRMFFHDLERVKKRDRLTMFLSVEDDPLKFLSQLLK